MERLSLGAVTVLMTLVGMIGLGQAENTVGALQTKANGTSKSVATIQAVVNDGDIVPARAKMYYLTATLFTGGEAEMACGPKFHIASIDEIHYPNNLQYVTRGLDSVAYDRVSNSPSDRTGWVRPGSHTLTGSLPDCSLYHSSSDQQSGTTMTLHTPDGGSRMNPSTLGPTGPNPWWQVFQQTCALSASVWCIEDPE